MGRAAQKVSQNNSQTADILSRIQDIPTLPLVAAKVNELINDPTSSSSDIAEVLKKDQVLTAKILRLVNSSYYSIPGGVTDVQRALAYLGFNTIAQLVLGVSVFELFSTKENEDFSILDFWKHALGTAVCSELLAKRLKYPKPEEVFTCGLLHDIGKLVLLQLDREKFMKINQETKKRNCSFVEIEREWELAGHAYIGELVATKWGLPQVIRLAIRYHHFDVTSMDSVISSAKPVIHMVRLANLICIKNDIGKSGDCSREAVPEEAFTRLKLSSSHLPEIEEKLEEEVQKASAFLNV